MAAWEEVVSESSLGLRILIDTIICRFLDIEVAFFYLIPKLAMA
jgi:hypothetical protein